MLLKLAQPQSNNSWLVVGLGNPGPSYQSNRHNVGQQVLDVLASRIGVNFKSHKTIALCAEGRLSPGAPKVILAKSTGYMNLSGAPVSALMKYYSVPIERVIVVHDELDIPFGDIRTKLSGGHAGHNGLRDIISKCSAEFHRIRFGIGRPPGRQEVADFVLEDFGSSERKELPVLLELAADQVENLVA
ncbi:aminoacyl-tRNA hydrolase [Aquiluna borgnonia]|uniref:Peptidyl-tRNA hydrolase n=1 Tax=Aquiluna borgnonia TaxID=2499157 RepID=A0A7D4PRE4_9MICO|nr:aminoacyl-tRNA hydrolase [Aquiluna borgnonia]QKJ25926.1 aminoacyl-tRNA hydrolase [Aquiluna borgnonia]